MLIINLLHPRAHPDMLGVIPDMLDPQDQQQDGLENEKESAPGGGMGQNALFPISVCHANPLVEGDQHDGKAHLQSAARTTCGKAPRLTSSCQRQPRCHDPPRAEKAEAIAATLIFLSTVVKLPQYQRGLWARVS
jgi:hypothetical protein